MIRNSGVGIAQWLKRRTRDQKVTGSSRGGREIFVIVFVLFCSSLHWSVFFADPYFGIRSTPRVTAIAR